MKRIRRALAALAAPRKEGDQTLTEYLAGQGLFTLEAYRQARDGAVTGEKKETTVLVYVVASDLERLQGQATADLEEMLAAGLGEEVNVVLQTGGTTDWQNPWMTDGATQRFLLAGGEPVHLADLDQAPMCRPVHAGVLEPRRRHHGGLRQG